MFFESRIHPHSSDLVILGSSLTSAFEALRLLSLLLLPLLQLTDFCPPPYLVASITSWLLLPRMFGYLTFLSLLCNTNALLQLRQPPHCFQNNFYLHKFTLLLWTQIFCSFLPQNIVKSLYFKAPSLLILNSSNGFFEWLLCIKSSCWPMMNQQHEQEINLLRFGGYLFLQHNLAYPDWSTDFREVI